MLLLLSRDEAYEMAQRHVTDTNLSEILKSQNFDENCRILMNRATLADQAKPVSDHRLIW